MMASPQTENGYTMIANELFDALINFRICGEHRQVLDFIIRKTYGFKKKTDAIPLSQFVKATGIQKAHVIRAINALKLCNIIKGAKTGTFNVVIYGINKDYTKWRKVPKRALLPKRAIKGAKIGNEKVPKQAHSKETTKETTKESVYTQDFLTFCSKYPGKINKDYAYECWQKKSKVRPTIKEILTVIENQIEEKKQQIEIEGWAPGWKVASTWINQQCWNDEIKVFKLRLAPPQRPSAPKIDQQAIEETRQRNAKLSDLNVFQEMP